MFFQRMRSSIPLGALLLVGAGCQDLDTENFNAPDRDRALNTPGDVQALIAGTLAPWFQTTHNGGALHIVHGPEMVSTATPGGGIAEIVREPRWALDNNIIIAGSGPNQPRNQWGVLNQIPASANDGLQVIEALGGTLTVASVDVTARNRAFAKFMQGVAWGYLAMFYDRGYYIDETMELESDPVVQGLAILTPSEELIELAVDALDAARAIAEQNPTLSYAAYPGTSLYFASTKSWSSAQFIQLCNTMAARLLVLNARTPEERRDVDWQRVLTYTANGLTQDLDLALASGFRSSGIYGQQSNGNARLTYRLIGPADVSGKWQEWIAAPLNDRNRFDITTPDRRITGATPQSNGAYTRYRIDDQGFSFTFANHGLFLFSAYQWARHSHTWGGGGETANDRGTAPMITVDENRLLRAEALLRTGNLQGAADLINVTRTRSQVADGVTYPGLPPVTTAGVPQSADCVPRTDTGACGDLMVALRYERAIEMIALDGNRGFFDLRGFGLMPDGSWLQAPVPAGDLELLGQPIYTYGGQDDPEGAVYHPVTMQDL